MKKRNSDKSEQITKPILGRGLRAIALRQIKINDLPDAIVTATHKTTDLCVTNACTKSGTIAL